MKISAYQESTDTTPNGWLFLAELQGDGSYETKKIAPDKIGAQGVVGPQGLPGDTGPAGPPGAMGLPGTNGTNGTDGTNGTNGAAGPAGTSSHSTLAYAATVDIDFLSDDYRSLTLAGNVTFTTSNRAAPRTVSIRIIGDGSARTFVFPAWNFVGGAAPSGIAANAIAIVTITCFGANDSDAIAAYAVTP